MLVENEYFELDVEGEQVLMRTKKNGFPLKSFDAITREHPRFRIDSFAILRKALTEPEEVHVVGSWLPEIEVAITQDRMKAQLVINIPIADFDQKKEKVIQQAEKLLDEAGIIHGRRPYWEDPYQPGEPIDAAIGTPPEKGKDAQIRYIEMPEKRPIIRDDGSADYYEMNFVTPIQEGQWLGEKIPPQEGIDGTDVLGHSIPSLRGHDAKLVYDRSSVHEVQEGDNIVLRAAHSGALEYTNGIVGVGKQLVIDGDVGPETGSISFNGTVIIRGTIIPGFSVTATGDISVEGNEGVTNAKEVLSSGGDIYIKGGVFGGGETVLEAQGDIFIKHANNCKLLGKNVHIGLYLIGTDVVADCVHVDKNKGKIIGGHIEALHLIECAIAGNSHERMTVLHARGTDKEGLYKEIQSLAKELKERRELVQRLEQHASQFQESGSRMAVQLEAYVKLKETLEENRSAILEMDQEIQLGMARIKQAVPPKIEVTKEAFPGVIIQVGSKSSTLHTSTNGVFEMADGVLNV
ncbi:FapA family protein [Sporosarcina sp. FSL W7-1349]|uniref:FapA family protein n=1 Tax=Sporosarcina sp. FSL W7-1349 TaxID=2921561 RepID=UPI0030F86AB1